MSHVTVDQRLPPRQLNTLSRGAMRTVHKTLQNILQTCNKRMEVERQDWRDGGGREERGRKWEFILPLTSGFPRLSLINSWRSTPISNQDNIQRKVMNTMPKTRLMIGGESTSTGPWAAKDVNKQTKEEEEKEKKCSYYSFVFKSCYMNWQYWYKLM